MEKSRMFTGIAALVTAGTLILAGCTAPEPVEESSSAAKAAVMTDTKTKAAVKADCTVKKADNKAVKKKSGSAKAKKTIKSLIFEDGKVRSKPADIRADDAAEDRQKSVESVKDNAKEKSSVKDSDAAPKETEVSEEDEAAVTESNSGAAQDWSDSESAENNVPVIPEEPEEPASVSIPETPEPASAPIPETPEPTSAPAPEPAEPAHEHTWEEVVELVHHDAVYGEPPLIAPAEDITYDVTEMHTICGICGANLDEVGVEHDYMHMENGEGFWYYNDYIVVGQRTEHFDAEYGEPPLITPAYDEWVGTGRYRCTGCGETK